MTGNRGPNSFHMFRREGWPQRRSSLNQHGPGAESSDESGTFSHCNPGNLPLVAGLGGGIVGEWLVLMKSTCDSLRQEVKGTG